MDEELQPWTATRKVALLLRVISGETPLADVCREHGLERLVVEAWMDTFLAAGQRGLKGGPEIDNWDQQSSTIIDR